MAHTNPNAASVATPVGFYRGPSANLNGLAGNYKDGAFYITTDTDRLYYAKGANDLVQLNKSIIVVSEFPNTNNRRVGEFYYKTGTGELAYCDANNALVHVNYDTNISVASIVGSSDVSASKDKLTLTLTLNQQNKDGSSAGDAITTDFVITQAQLEEVIKPLIPKYNDTKVAIGATVDTSAKKATVSLSGTGHDSSANNFTITAGDGIAVAGDANNNITISSDAYTLSASGTDIILSKNNGAQNTIPLVGENAGDVEVKAFTENNTAGIKITHKSYGSDTKKEAVVTSGSVNYEDDIVIVKGVEVSNGHVTGITTDTFKLPKNTGVSEVSANNEGKIIIKSMDGEEITSKQQDLFYKINNNTRYNQADITDDIKAITRDIVQNNLATITNSMTFKGGLSGNDESEITIESLLANATISAGDVYIVQDGKITVTDAYDDTKIATKGDLIIASGQEDDDGVIETVQWIVIEGTEVDTTYELKCVDNSIVLKETNGEDVSTLTLSGDDAVSIETDGDTINVKHATFEESIVNATVSSIEIDLDEDQSIDVIVGYDTDGFGHVKELQKSTLTFKAQPDQTNNHSLSLNEDNEIVLNNKDGQGMGAIKIVAADGVEGKSNPVNVSYSSADSKIAIGHNTITQADDSVKCQKKIGSEPGQGTEVIGQVFVDDYGHVTGVSYDQLYVNEYEFNESSISIAQANNGAAITETLYNNSGASAGAIQFNIAAAADSNIVVAADANNNTVNLSLVWGTF